MTKLKVLFPDVIFTVSFTFFNASIPICRTNLQQEAVIKVFGISFGDHCENLIKTTMANNAGKVGILGNYLNYY